MLPVRGHGPPGQARVQVAAIKRTRSSVAVVRLLLGLAIGLACIVWAAFAVDLGEVAATLRQTDLVLTGLALATVLLTTYAKAARWGALVEGPKNTAWNLLPALVIGQMLNTVMPARVGDLGRVVVAGEATGQGKAYLLGSVVLEKLVDGLCLLAALAVLFVFLSPPSWLLSQGTSAGLSIAVLALAIIALILFGDRLLTLASNLLSRLPGRAGAYLTRVLGEGLRGLSGLNGWRQRGAVALWSVLIWVSSASTNWLVFHAAGLDLGAGPALLVLIILQVGGSVPSIPGRVGVFHSLVVVALGLVGVEVALALSVAVILHLIVVGTQLVLGLIFVWRESLDPRRLASVGNPGAPNSV